MLKHLNVKHILPLLQILIGSGILYLVSMLYIQASLAQTIQSSEVTRLHFGSQYNESTHMNAIFRDADREKIKQLSPAVEDLAIIDTQPTYSIEWKNKKYKILSALMVSTHFNQFANLKMIEGRFFFAQDIKNQSNHIVISEKTKQVLFKNDPALGKSLRIDSMNGDSSSYKIIGVIANAPPYSATAAEVYFPVGNSNHQLSSTLLVKSKYYLTQLALAQVKSAVRKFGENDPSFMNANGEFFTDQLTAPWSDISRVPKATFAFFVVLTILSLAFSTMSMQLSNLQNKTKFIALKRAFGATRKRIFLETFYEVCLISGLGGLLGLLFATMLWPHVSQIMLNMLLPFSLPFALMIFGGFLFVTFLFSLYPAMIAAHLPPSEAAKS